jgi:hypothetical protein
MDKYDRNILNLFKYYNREYVLLESNTKEDDSTKANEKNICNSFEEIVTKKTHGDIHMQSPKLLNDIRSLMNMNNIILNSSTGFTNDIETVCLIRELLLNNGRFADLSALFNDILILENTIGILYRNMLEEHYKTKLFPVYFNGI